MTLFSLCILLVLLLKSMRSICAPVNRIEFHVCTLHLVILEILSLMGLSIAIYKSGLVLASKVWNENTEKKRYSLGRRMSYTCM